MGQFQEWGGFLEAWSSGSWRSREIQIRPVDSKPQGVGWASAGIFLCRV